MARIKSKRSALQTLSCKFGGMGQNTPLSPIGAQDMCNFRILPDGTLRVRSGYTLKKRFASGKRVRGFWEGTVGGTFFSFAVVGDKIYRLSGDAMDETAVGTVANGEENVHFCVYLDMLYLLDGQSIHVYSSSKNKFVEAEPYVPLYGYSWDPTTYGSVNEDINLLTPRLRVHYYNTSGATSFVLPYYANTVDIVRANGDKITNYGFTAGTNKVSIGTAPTIVEIGFTVSLNAELRAAMLAAQMSFIYSRNQESKMLIGDSSGRLFLSREVTQAMLASCHSLYPNANQLYFCMDDILFLGDNAHPVTTICPLYETLLVFTSDRIWSLAFEKGELKTTLASKDIGCSSKCGVIEYEDCVLAAMASGLYRISASPARPEHLVFEKISNGMDNKLPLGFTHNVILIHDRMNNEIWLRDPWDTAGEVWVWNIDKKDWYRFENINASFFFKKDGNMGFAEESKLLLFDRYTTTDNGYPIQARYQSTYMDLGTSDAPKRSMRAFLYSSPGKNHEMLFETERGERSYRLYTSSADGAPRQDDMRIGTHRHRFLRFILSVGEGGPSEFYRLDIYSKP